MNELILGLLSITPMTSYDIRQAIKNGMGMMSSDSMGNIHSAIKSLTKQNAIQFSETVENNKFKKIYSITPTGESLFESWINLPFELSQKRNTELKKIYFMGLSDPKNRISRIEKYVTNMSMEQETLNMLHNHGISILDSLDDSQKELAFFQLKTIQFGIDMITFEINWYQNLIKEMDHKN